MAEQNILTGDLAVLDQIIGDLKEHRKNKEQLEKLNEIAKDLTKNIENDERELKEEIDGRIKESTASICEGYDKAIDSEKSKLKDIQSQRDKAKMAGVKERIANETKELRNQNEEFEKQIKDAFKMEKVPMYCSRWFYRIMIQTRGFADSAVYTLILLVLFLGIPALISFVPSILTRMKKCMVLRIMILRSMKYMIAWKRLKVRKPVLCRSLKTLQSRT